MGEEYQQQDIDSDNEDYPGLRDEMRDEHRYDPANRLHRMDHPKEGPFPIIGHEDEQGNILPQRMPDGYDLVYEWRQAEKARAEAADVQAQGPVFQEHEMQGLHQAVEEEVEVACDESPEADHHAALISQLPPSELPRWVRASLADPNGTLSTVHFLRIRDMVDEELQKNALQRTPEDVWKIHRKIYHAEKEYAVGLKYLCEDTPPVEESTHMERTTQTEEPTSAPDAVDLEEMDDMEETGLDAYKINNFIRYVLLAIAFFSLNLVFGKEEKRVPFWKGSQWRKFLRPFDQFKTVSEAKIDAFLKKKAALDKELENEWSAMETMRLVNEAQAETKSHHLNRTEPMEKRPSEDRNGEGPSPKRPRTDSRETDESSGNRIQPDSDIDMDIPGTSDHCAPPSPSNQDAGSSSGTSTPNPVTSTEPCYVCSETVRWTGVGRLLCQTPRCFVKPNEDYFWFEEKIIRKKNKKRTKPAKTFQYCGDCVKKSGFLRRKVKQAGAEPERNEKKEEIFLECKEENCTKRAHEKCLSAYEFFGDFVCGPCLDASGKEPTKEAQATDLNHTPMSQQGEYFIRRKFPGLDIKLRELNRSQAIADIDEIIPKPYQKHFGHMKGKTVVSRTFGAFQRNQGKDGMIGVLFVDEYSKIGKEHWVTINFIDTVWPYSKLEMEKDKKKISKSGQVAKALMEWYLINSRDRGYTHAHLWARAAEKGEDFSFYLHPEYQAYAKQDKLQEWWEDLFRTMRANNEIKNFYSFGERRPVINTIGDIHQLPAFLNSLWSVMIDWAHDATLKSNLRNAEKKEAKFLKTLHGYMDDHMNDNYVIELNPGDKKPDPVSLTEKDLMVIPFAMSSELFCGFLQDCRMGCNTLRDQQAATGAVIVEIVTILENLKKQAGRQVDEMDSDDDIMEPVEEMESDDETDSDDEMEVDEMEVDEMADNAE